jgi:hypothetical protein
MSFCKTFHPTMQQIMAKYGTQVRWVFRHFPLDSIHSQARPEAIASECAAEQGKFWEFIDKVYAVTPGNDGLDLSQLGNYAKEAGVKNISKFQSCVDSKKYADRVQRDSTSGAEGECVELPNTIIVGPNGRNDYCKRSRTFLFCRSKTSTILEIRLLSKFKTTWHKKARLFFLFANY